MQSADIPEIMIQTYFNTSAIGDLGFALHKEYLITSEKGLYASSSLCTCHQRKYHGLLVAPQPQIDSENHLLISGIDETIKTGNCSVNFAIHKYPGLYHPEGQHYIKEFYGTPILKWVYQLHDIILTKEILLSDKESGALIRYSLEEASGDIELTFVPLMAFRNIHKLCKANGHVNTKVTSVANGIKLKLYPDYSDMYLQFSDKVNFIPAPDWYHNIEYSIERTRGYDYQEDLYTPGRFEMVAKKGEQVILYAGLNMVSPRLLKKRFSQLLQKAPILKTMEDCLYHAGKQFFIRKNGKSEIKAGYPWFGSWSRDTFISLPGLTLVPGYLKTFKAIIKSLLPTLKKGLFPNTGSGSEAYNSVDAPLWFIWAIQQYALYTNSEDTIWKEYKRPLQSILDNYAKGTLYSIKMDSDGLIHAGEPGYALTWMDSIVEGKAVTPRIGKPIEINALWYNGICFCLEAASQGGDDEFITKWKNYPEKIKTSFMDNFIEEGKGYLADYTDGSYKDWSIRPNQIFALSLPYSPVPAYMHKPMLNTVKEELLTSRGLRTLSPADPYYHGEYFGSQHSRDQAYHQGTVWPWLLGHFAEAYLKVYDTNGILFIEQLYKGFEPALAELCLYTVPELYNGNVPHKPGGAVAQAWSIAELLRMNHLIKSYKSKVATDREVNAL